MQNPTENTAPKCSAWNCNRPAKYRVVIEGQSEVYSCCCNRVGLMQLASGIGKDAKFYPVNPPGKQNP